MRCIYMSSVVQCKVRHKYNRKSFCFYILSSCNQQMFVMFAGDQGY